MSKGLDALEENLELVSFNKNEDLSNYLTNYYIIEKDLKVLEIIKKKRVNTYNLSKYKTYLDYKLEWKINSDVFKITQDYKSFELSVYLLTETEFNLIKEWLER